MSGNNSGSDSMQLAVEISMYPLADEYIPPIQAFIDCLHTYEGLRVRTTHTSTLISGDYDLVMQVMQQEVKKVHQNLGQAVFVCKYLNATNMDLQD